MVASMVHSKVVHWVLLMVDSMVVRMEHYWVDY
jgi:hypothetical protein